MDNFKVPATPTPAKQEHQEHDKEAVEGTSPLPAAPGSDVAPEPATEQEKEQQPKVQVLRVSKKHQTASDTYKEPQWSAPPPSHINYSFEVLKSGQIIEEVKELQKQPLWRFGRLPTNDIPMANPSISRFHAVLQYKPSSSAANKESKELDDTVDLEPPPDEGWYIYDLGSTHGTYLNKQRVPPRVYVRVRVGHLLRLGSSGRSFILKGPDEDAEPESELSVSELRAQRQKEKDAAVAEAQRKAAEEQERERNEGVSWGMAEDADEATDLTHNPYASTNNEELFLDDPKKTLRGYYEREGQTLEYKCDEMSSGTFVCRVELPLDDANGRPLVAEVVHKGRKKECVVQCALEACRILDRHGVLRQTHQEPMKRKPRKKESDSDDDEFLDRTGDAERKKQRKTNPGSTAALTYDDLMAEKKQLDAKLQQVEDDISRYQETERRLKTTRAQLADSNDLDRYMENLESAVSDLDRTEIRKLRTEQNQLKAEQQRVLQLIKIAKPIELSFTKTQGIVLRSTAEAVFKPEGVKKPRPQPLIGKRNQFSKFKVATAPSAAVSKPISSEKNVAPEVEEEVEEEDEADALAKKETRGGQAKPGETETSIAALVKDTKEGIENSAVHSSGSTKTTVDELATKRQASAETPKETRKNKSGKLQPEELKDDGDAVVDVAADVTIPIPTDAASTDTNAEDADGANRKRRRQRQRHKRLEDMEELEEHESSEKYAKWVPPANQSGDGFTELNKKYGY